MEKNINIPAIPSNTNTSKEANTAIPPVPGKNIQEVAKNLKKDVNGNVITGAAITGASTAIGALVGAVAGSLTVNAMNSNEINPDDIIIDVEPNDPDIDPIVVDPEPIPTPGPQPVPMSAPAPSQEIQITDYQHITDPNGIEMDIAILNIDGTEVGIIDYDMDGRADIMIADANGDGVIDENEVVQLDDIDISMMALQEQCNNDTNIYLAQNDPDYTNDANVDNYFA